MDRILRYFPDLSQLQKERFAALEGLYVEWNSKINVISRRDIGSFITHHVLHSLSIGKTALFASGESVLDLGTGGGFPGIPLAILFPETKFTLCDSIGKKIRVAQTVAQSLGLGNVRCVNSRAESIGESFDYVVSRAVARLRELYPWIKDSYRKYIICLKGGDLQEEIREFQKGCRVKEERIVVLDIPIFFNEAYFVGKKIVIISR
ncbi:MAG: 16S rRNA (guanine(527)-N(7))-methyltransferase RsmG [Bacteroidales bacterium]|jgi:16S rRNA (guanine527-N7)-methyltransferase|nr:16S rRNA (guanine(527)-N(7))-methyltransferase RsmG [Bacteroidales bacterium]